MAPWKQEKDAASLSKINNHNTNSNDNMEYRTRAEAESQPDTALVVVSFWLLTILLYCGQFALVVVVFAMLLFYLSSMKVCVQVNRGGVAFALGAPAPPQAHRHFRRHSRAHMLADGPAGE